MIMSLSMPNTEPDDVMSGDPQKRRITVAAGVIVNDRRQILLAKRPQHVHQGGLWEFPGGKVEASETVDAALSRELFEELAIEVTSAIPMLKVSHDYPDKSVFLDVWLVDSFRGIPHGNEGQEVRWVDVEQIDSFSFPEANVVIVDAVKQYFVEQ